MAAQGWEGLGQVIPGWVEVRMDLLEVGGVDTGLNGGNNGFAALH